MDGITPRQLPREESVSFALWKRSAERIVRELRSASSVSSFRSEASETVELVMKYLYL